MWVWKIVRDSDVELLDSNSVPSIISDLVNKTNLSPHFIFKTREQKSHTILKNIEHLNLYFRDYSANRCIEGQKLHYKIFIKSTQIRVKSNFTENSSSERQELSNAIYFLRKHPKSGLLMRIDCLVDLSQENNKNFVILFKHRDLALLEYLFKEDVRSDRNKRRGITLSKTLMKQKETSHSVLANREKARLIGSNTNRLKAIERDRARIPIILDLHRKGKGLTEIAMELNQIETTNKRWYPSQVSRILKRLHELNY